MLFKSLSRNKLFPAHVKLHPAVMWDSTIEMKNLQTKIYNFSLTLVAITEGVWLVKATGHGVNIPHDYVGAPNGDDYRPWIDSLLEDVVKLTPDEYRWTDDLIQKS